MTIRVWDLATRSATLTLTGHTTQIHGLAFSPDGTRIASVSGNGQNRGSAPEVKVWDASSGRELGSWIGKAPRSPAASSMDGDSPAE
ncbi:MAG: hypothetical protein U0935_09635 [Pirellulales bacterium]